MQEQEIAGTGSLNKFAALAVWVVLCAGLLLACVPLARTNNTSSGSLAPLAQIELWGLQGDLEVYDYTTYEVITNDLKVASSNDRGTVTSAFNLPLGRYHITVSNIALSKGESFDPQVFGAHIGLSVQGRTIGFNPRIFINTEPKSFCRPDENLLQNPLNLMRAFSFLTRQNGKEKMDNAEALGFLTDLTRRSSKTGLLCAGSGIYQGISWQVVKNTPAEIVLDVGFK